MQRLVIWKTAELVAELSALGDALWSKGSNFSHHPCAGTGDKDTEDREAFRENLIFKGDIWFDFGIAFLASQDLRLENGLGDL